MDNTLTAEQNKLSFHGSGGAYFGIIIVNWLLTIITLGFYYPWAKAKQLEYLYGSVALNNDNFAFHGTGKEMFKGFIKAIVLFILVYGVFGILVFLHMPFIALLVFYIAILGIMPIAIHGSYRYRMSRTSWRGIRFGYRGTKAELFKLFLKGIFFTIITLGFYGAWFSMNIRNYVLGKVRFGSLEFKYKGNGNEYFVLNLVGYLLSILTLGIYAFWWQKNLFNYFIDNLSLHQGDKKINFKSTATGGGFFGLMIVNLLIIVCTFGLGYAWAVTRTMNFAINNIQLEGDIDFNAIIQTESNYTDATGEDINDFLDIDFVM